MKPENAAIHTPLNKTLFRFKFVTILDRPARSYDSSIVQNVWRAMVRKVCKNERPFKTRSELMSAIIKSQICESLQGFFFFAKASFHYAQEIYQGVATV